LRTVYPARDSGTGEAWARPDALVLDGEGHQVVLAPGAPAPGPGFAGGGGRGGRPRVRRAPPRARRPRWPAASACRGD
ncbi:hypothetical protein, partial [Nocardia neocaledoniensis]|uniref:hypothetical protein n=1 Tax=Nocardia neocaledoniensis TaxID=236511 RepID=UPI0024548829